MANTGLSRLVLYESGVDFVNKLLDIKLYRALVRGDDADKAFVIEEKGPGVDFVLPLSAPNDGSRFISDMMDSDTDYWTDTLVERVRVLAFPWLNSVIADLHSANGGNEMPVYALQGVEAKLTSSGQNNLVVNVEITVRMGYLSGDFGWGQGQNATDITRAQIVSSSNWS